MDKFAFYEYDGTFSANLAMRLATGALALWATVASLGTYRGSGAEPVTPLGIANSP